MLVSLCYIDIYDVYDDSRRYNNATNTSTSDNEGNGTLFTSSIIISVRGVLGGVGGCSSLSRQ